jgi:hypothetical protein
MKDAPFGDSDVRNIARLLLAVMLAVGVIAFLIGRWTA